MGGRGSGRSGGMGMLTDKCHEYHSVDIDWLRRKRYLRTGHSGNLTGLEAARRRQHQLSRRAARVALDLQDAAAWRRMAGRRRTGAVRSRRGRIWRQATSGFVCPSCRSPLPHPLWRRLFPMPALPSAQIRDPVRAPVRARREPGPQDPRTSRRQGRIDEPFPDGRKECTGGPTGASKPRCGTIAEMLGRWGWRGRSISSARGSNAGSGIPPFRNGRAAPEPRCRPRGTLRGITIWGTWTKMSSNVRVLDMS